MRGSVAKKGKRWYVILEEREPATGKRRRKWHSGPDGGWTRKRDAESACVDLVSRRQRGLYVTPSTVTLGEYLQDWLFGLSVRLRATTVDQYETIVAAYVLPHLGSLPLQHVSSTDLTALYARLVREGGRHGQGLAPKTVRNVHGVLSAALKDAEGAHLLAINPAQAAKPPRVSRGAREAWTASELRKFLEVAESDRMYAAAFVAATTGMRRSEVLGVAWNCVDLDSALLEVTQTLVMVGNDPVLVGDTKTARSRRQVALDDATVTVLREHRRLRLAERLAWGEAWRNHGLVFCQEDGTPVRPDWFTRWVNRTARESGVKMIGTHGLRHTWATLALKAGVHVKVVSERLGHASVATTMDIYSHVLPSMQREAAQVVTDLILEG